MEIRYTLTLADHLAWYDYYLSTPEGKRLRCSFPFVDRFRRWRFSQHVISPPSRHALGERTLEATEKGVREFSPEFSFATAWKDIGMVAVTPSRLFLAHTSMNAHIIPLRFFQSDAQCETFVSFARERIMLP